MVSELAVPTLEDLRDAPEAAWLWDPARARIAWANRAGISYFGGETLFDLVDRPFDPREAGVERIVSLSRSLTRGQSDRALLHFPSSGATVPLACTCAVHALGDGRPGLLVVANRSVAEQAGQSEKDAAAAFNLLPSAAALLGRAGEIRGLNAAALTMLKATQRASLGGLLGDDRLADEYLERTEAAALVVLTKPLAVRVGTRDIRLTFRRLDRPEGDAAFAMLLLDDVTDRRALERRLETTSAAPQREPPAEAPAEKHAASSLSEADAAAFEMLGRTLEEGIRRLPRQPAPADIAPAPQPQPPRRRLPPLPEQVRAPLEHRADAVLVTKDGELIFANPAAARLFGHGDAEDVINDFLLAATFGGLTQPLPPGDIHPATGQTVRAAAQMTVIPWLNGAARLFVLSPAEAPQAAKPSADVIQLPLRATPSEADQELRAILDTAADGIITLDRDARIHTFSAGAEAIFGYRIAEVAGKPFLDLLAPESRKTVRDYLSALQGPGLASVFNDGREVTATVRQGGTVPLFLTIGKLQAPRSQAAFCAVVRDITQWKKTEAELREAKEKAEATSRQKSEFLASVSHELRTPLNAIMGFSEVMRLGRFGEIDNEKYRGYVQDIHASGAHLLSLINDLLDLSKVEAGKLELNFTAVSLNDVADHAVKLLQEQATAARVVLRKSFPADLPKVVADLRSLRQIMLNLISNAIKFTDAGGQVVISAQLLSSGELRIKVKDTGIGMDEDQLKSALEPFGRVVTEGREAQGTGLGLPLTKALIEANRASFHLASEPGKGTLAEITFPVTRVLAE